MHTADPQRAENTGRMKEERNREFGIEKAIQKYGCAVIVPGGNSMLPLLKPDQCSVWIKKKETYHKYEIVLYRRRDGRFILHRIVGIEKEGFVLCGDNQTEKEKGIRKEQILGAAEQWEENGKTITSGAFGYRLYVFFWCRLFFLRRLVFLPGKLVRRVRYQLKQKME